jgi:hypothetical protein
MRSEVKIKDGARRALSALRGTRKEFALTPNPLPQTSYPVFSFSEPRTPHPVPRTRVFYD